MKDLVMAHAPKSSVRVDLPAVFDDDDVDSLRRWYPDESADALDSMVNLRRIVIAICSYLRGNDGHMPPPFTTDTKPQNVTA